MSTKYETQFTQVPFGLFRDREMYTELHSCLPIYMYLQTCVYRGIHTKDKFKLYDNYYLQNKLVASVTYETIGRAHGGMCYREVKKRIDLLAKYGFIEIKEIKTKYRKGKKWIIGHQKLYYLGTHIGGIPNYRARNITFCESTVGGD